MVEPIYQLIDTILRAERPSEAVAFAAVGRDIISSRLEMGRSGGSDRTQYGFAPELETGLLMVHLIAGTLSVVEMYVTARRIRKEKLEEDELQHSWEEWLVKNDVPPSIARLISVRHGAELFRIVTGATKDKP